MAQDFNLSDDMVIRFEQALQALSNASDAIDNASLVLRDGLYNARLTQRQEQEAREAASSTESSTCCVRLFRRWRAHVEEFAGWLLL